MSLKIRTLYNHVLPVSADKTSMTMGKISTLVTFAATMGLLDIHRNIGGTSWFCSPDNIQALLC